MLDSIISFFSIESDIYKIIVVLSVIMIALLLLSFPMVVSLTITTIVGFVVFSDLPLQNIIQQMITGISPNALIAIPMFVFAADIMTRGHTAKNLLDFVEVFIGHYKSGLPITACISCTLFGSVSGSTQATVVSVGTIMRPKLLKAGYKDSFIMALIINASDIAWLIPPSIGLILFGVLANANIAELFVAGILPGLLLTFLFSAYCYAYSVYHKDSLVTVAKSNFKEKLQATKKALLPLGFPVLIVGGIYSGIFTPTEAASFSVLYAFILEVIIYRELNLKDIIDSALNTGLITGVVFILVGAGQAFSWYISFEAIPQELLSSLDVENSSQEYILFIIALSFLIGCMFVDSIVVLLILIPIFAPIIETAELDVVLVGVLVTLQMAMGSATPPFGCDIFTAVAIFKKKYMDVIRGIFPFIAILMLTTAVLIYFPQTVLFLRDIAFNK